MKYIIIFFYYSITFFSPSTYATEYVIDTNKAHAFIQFKISHLGYSWLWGRFNTFSGTFHYDEKSPSASKVHIKIDTASIDSNHAERDKHLRDKRFLDVKRFPTATFVSTHYSEDAEGKGKLVGQLTLHGVTNNITIITQQLGVGADPWGGHRRGFEGHAMLTLADYGMTYNLGPKSKEVELILSIEGIQQE